MRFNGRAGPNRLIKSYYWDRIYSVENTQRTWLTDHEIVLIYAGTKYLGILHHLRAGLLIAMQIVSSLHGSLCNATSMSW